MTASRLLSCCVLLSVLVACQEKEIPQVPEKVVGHCLYTNKFSDLQECRDYVGEWTEQEAVEDCKDQGSTVELGSACNMEERLGYCFLEGGDEKWSRITFPGVDAQTCGTMQRGCELFGGGVFDPSPVCGGKVVDMGDTGLPTFQQPVLTCVDPKQGEPPGMSEGGKVCTWEMISRRHRARPQLQRVRELRPRAHPAPVLPGASRGERGAGRRAHEGSDVRLRAQLGEVAD